MRALIFGVRHQGKSTLAMNLALRARTPEGLLKSIVIIDPNAVWDGYFTVYQSKDVSRWLQAPYADRYRILVMRPTPGQIPEDFEETTKQLRGSLWDYGNYVLIVDEASLFQRSSMMHPALDAYLRQAPASIDVIQTMHRQVDSHTLGRTLVTDTFYFHSSQLRELELIEDQWGPNVAPAVAHLGIHQFVHCWLDVGGIRKYAIIRTPERWYSRINAGIDPRTIAR